MSRRIALIVAALFGALAAIAMPALAAGHHTYNGSKVPCGALMTGTDLNGSVCTVQVAQPSYDSQGRQVLLVRMLKGPEAGGHWLFHISSH